MNQQSRQETERKILKELAQEIRKSSSTVRFPVYLSESLMKKSLDELELSVRSVNCLRRAGYQTIGQLVEGISGSADLRRIRNCGTRSVSEIMTKLLLYQLTSLSPERREAFLRRVYLLSTHPEMAEKVPGGGADQ